MLEFECFVGILLLVAIVVLLCVLIRRVSEGFRVAFEHLQGIEDEVVSLANYLDKNDGEVAD